MRARDWRWREALPALAILAAQKASLLLAARCRLGAVDLMRWDAVWFRGIAESGYRWPGEAAASGAAISNLAFFPALPLAARAVGSALPLGSGAALTLVAWLGTLAAGLGIYAVGRQVADRNVATWLVVLWGAAPRALVEVLPYSEGLFTALVAWSLYALLRRRWLLLAGLCFAAGLTRAAVLPLVGALALEATLARRSAGLSPRDRLRCLTAAAAGAPGFVAYWAYVAVRVGRWDGYLLVQRQWGTTMGTPWETVAAIAREALPAQGNLVRGPDIVLTLLLYAVLIGLMIRGRERPALTAYAGLTWLWAVCAQGYFHSKARFLLPAFTAWLPAARLLARRPVAVQVVVGTLWTALSVRVDVSVLANPWSP